MAAPIQIKDLITDSASRITMRWKEPYVTEGINKKMAVTLPHGIYRGWKLGTSGTNLTITLLPDSENNDHVLTVRTTLGDTLTLRRTGGNLSLPLTAPEFASQTVVIGVYVTYSVTAETQAEIRGYLLADWNALDASSQDAVTVLGTVNVPGSGIINAADISHERRSESWAKSAPAAIPWAPLVKNSSFEWGPPAALGQGRWPPWENTLVPNGNWTVSVADPEPSSGLQHLQLTSTLGAAALTGTVWQKLDVPIQRGQHVRLRFKVKAVQAATGGTLTVTVRFRDTVGAATDSVQTVTLTAPDASYRTFDKIITIPAGVSQVGEVRIDANSLVFAVATAAVRIDSLQLFLETQDVLSAHPEDSGKGPVVASSVVLTDPASGATSNSVRIRVDPAGGTTGAGQIIVERPDGDTFAAQPTLLVRGPVTSGNVITFTGGGVITGTGHVDLTAEGASSITALHGVGGAPDGIGVWGDGTGTGQGVYGKGSGGAATVPPKAQQGVLGVGGAGGHGVQGVGEGVGAGVIGKSGTATNSAGGDFTSIAGTSGSGVNALGSGAGPGVKGTGGTTNNSFGGEFTSSAVNGHGVKADGVGAAGIGLVAKGGLLTTGTAITAEATSPSGHGIVISHNNTAGTGYGLIAASNGQANTIYAAQVASTGTPGYAIKGYGFAGGVQGQGFFLPGVLGEAMNTLAIAGVKGQGLGAAPGVYGIGGTGSPGVRGEASALWAVMGMGTAGNTHGVRGQGSGNSPGVSGQGTGNNSYGGYFESIGSPGYGVYGVGKANGIGVTGVGDQTNIGTGVAGTGGMGGGYGVYAFGTDDYAVRADGWSGGIWATSQSGAGPGVYGNSIAGGGDGVQGYANGSGRGGYFESPAGIAVHGKGGTASVTGSGVLGEAVNASDANSYGVKGVCYLGKAGVWGVSNDVGAPAGLFQSPGYGVIAEGVIGLRVAGTTIAVRSAGYFDFTAPGGFGAPSNPAYNDAAYNRITAKNTVKAWAQVVFDSQTPAAGRIIDGFNVNQITRSGSRYFCGFVSAIGRPNLAGTGDSFTLSGITITFTKTGAGFSAADVGRRIIITGATTANNNGSYIITACYNPNQVEYLNALGVTEAFPGTWSISETPYAVAIGISDSTHTVRFDETHTNHVGFVIRNSAGSAINSGLDLVRVLITVTGPQY